MSRDDLDAQLKKTLGRTRPLEMDRFVNRVMGALQEERQREQPAPSRGRKAPTFWRWRIHRRILGYSTAVGLAAAAALVLLLSRPGGDGRFDFGGMPLAEANFGPPVPPFSQAEALLAQCDASILAPAHARTLDVTDPLLQPHSIWDQQMEPESKESMPGKGE
jgi:hypothetical protein